MTMTVAASEKRSLETALGLRESYAHQARTVLARLRKVGAVRENATVVDLGAAQGMFVLACAELGYDAVGVEPFAPARAVAAAVAERENVSIRMLEGTAESIPLDDEAADVVHARSVVEHVVDVERTFAEVFRVLKPGGIFWFGTASSMCPRQSEIVGFPAFGWYPDPAKRAIMRWCEKNHPERIGHGIPALHWFTPAKARRLLRGAGFSNVYDRWDLRRSEEGGRAYRLGLNAIKGVPGGKLLADVVVSGCSYAATKA